MAPTLVASYAVYSAGADTSTLTTASFTPSNGEVLVVKLATWDTGNGMAAPSGGAQTFTAVGIAAPGGFNGWCAVYTAPVSGSPGAMTVSSAPATGTATRHSMVVERWSGAQLAGTPATNATKSGTGTTATTTLTSTGTGSVVSWCMVDENSRDPAASSYVTTSGTPTQDGLYDGHVGSNSVQYFAYQDAAAAGSQTFGVTNASSLAWVAVGVEVQAAAGAAVSGDVTATGTGSITATGANTAPAATTSTGTGSVTASAVNAAAGAATATVTASVTAAAQLGSEVVSSGSWYGLLDIYREGVDWARAERSSPPQACPNDGEPLETGPDGRLFCRFDGWRPDGAYPLR